MQSRDLKHVSAVGVDAHHILIVEDDRDQADALKAFLESCGHKVTLAKDGGQAHSAFVMRKPDFVILDLILPGESGFEICEHMKQTNDSIPVMVLTAIDMDDSRELAERIGADGYMTKPYDPRALRDNVLAIAERVWQRSHGLAPAQDEGMVRFHCSECGAKIKVKSIHRGRHMTCPKCLVSVTVPRHD